MSASESASPETVHEGIPLDERDLAAQRGPQQLLAGQPVPSLPLFIETASEQAFSCVTVTLQWPLPARRC